MTENPPENPRLPEPPEPEKGEESGHALYDLTVKRFVGGIHPTAKAAREAGRQVEGHKYETRKV